MFYISKVYTNYNLTSQWCILFYQPFLPVCFKEEKCTVLNEQSSLNGNTFDIFSSRYESRRNACWLGKRFATQPVTPTSSNVYLVELQKLGMDFTFSRAFVRVLFWSLPEWLSSHKLGFDCNMPNCQSVPTSQIPFSSPSWNSKPEKKSVTDRSVTWLTDKMQLHLRLS